MPHLNRCKKQVYFLIQNKNQKYQMDNINKRKDNYLTILK